MSMPNKEEVLEAIQPVTDPEMNISIVDLGLIYDVEADAWRDSKGRGTLLAILGELLSDRLGHPVVLTMV